MEPIFWRALDELVASSRIVIDRPRGSTHPRYPGAAYPFSYGYLDGTRGGDGEGIDVWIGSKPAGTVDAILCTLDPLKRDAEIKVLIGCSIEDRHSILDFVKIGSFVALLINRETPP